MPQTRTLVLTTINRILSGRPWDDTDFPEGGPIQERIHWILDHEGQYLIAVVIPVSAWLYHRFKGVWPSKDELIHTITTRKTGERDDDAIDAGTVQGKIELLLSSPTRRLLEQFETDRLRLSHALAASIDETPTRVYELITSLSVHIEEHRLNGESLRRAIRLGLYENTRDEKGRVRLCIAVWLHHRLSGLWPSHEEILSIPMLPSVPRAASQMSERAQKILCSLELAPDQKLSGGPLLNSIWSVLDQRTDGKDEETRLHVAGVLYNHLSGSAPTHQQMLEVFALKFEAGAIDQLIDTGTLRNRRSKIALGRKVDPTHTH